jgi:hypothetical protein
MSRWIAATLVTLLCATATPFAQGAVAGGWEVTINGPEGAITAGLTLKQEGEKLTGTIESPQGTAELSGTVKGAAVALAFQVQTPQGALDIKVTGEVSGASMKGVMDFGMGTADFTATKK